MDLNSIDDIKAFTEIQKIEKINRIEKKIRQRGYFPLIASLMFFIYAFWIASTNIQGLSPIDLFVIAIFISVLAQNNIEHSNLLKELFELKYGK